MRPIFDKQLQQQFINACESGDVDFASEITKKFINCFLKDLEVCPEISFTVNSSHASVAGNYRLMTLYCMDESQPIVDQELRILRNEAEAGERTAV